MPYAKKRSYFTFKKHITFHDMNHTESNVKKRMNFEDGCGGRNVLHLTIGWKNQGCKGEERENNELKFEGIWST